MAYIIDPGTYPTAGILSEQVMTIYDTLKPQHIPVLMSRYGEQFLPMFEMFRAMGRERPIMGDEWYGHEENWYHRTITTTGTLSSPGNGNPGNVTLDAADHDVNDGTFPRVGDIVSIPGTYVQALITVKNTSTPGAHVLTLRPLRTDQNIGAIASGTVLSITNGAFAAGMGQPDPTVVGTTKRKFVAQIFKESVGAEGSQLVNEQWFKVMDNNKSVVGWYTPGTDRGAYELALKMDGAYTWGDESNNVTQTTHRGNVNNVKTTKGVFPWVRDLGYVLNYTSGALDITDLYDLGLYLKSQGISTGVVIILVGAEFYIDVEGAAKTFFTGNSIDMTSKFGEKIFGTQDLVVNAGIKGIKLGGIVYLFKPMDVWSNPMTWGATGYNLAKYALAFPLTKFKDPTNGNVMLNNIESCYRAKGAYNRRFETWRVAGAGGGLYVNDIDEENTYFRGHHGLQFLKVNQSAMFKPV